MGDAPPGGPRLYHNPDADDLDERCGPTSLGTWLTRLLLLAASWFTAYAWYYTIRGLTR